ncbi:putative membrane protein [Pedobacter westerhofensis]|uniref:Putative membrane protein n=2 Tax=Pedobacter westerhofensis TaxID=425512 RepID=A0A521DTU5_9SPHI|nr:putative membrane protein [Pedobacter westerhofensis]
MRDFYIDVVIVLLFLNMESSNNRKSAAGANDHLANERTFLAWIRTGIGIMGFGFVVVKFSLFMKQVTAVLGNQMHIHQTGDSRVIGIFIVALGTCVVIFSYLSYMNTKRQLDEGRYYHSTMFVKIITIMIFLVSVLLLIYLMKTT